MANITGTVAAGYTWVAGADGTFQITKERLNLTAVPTVTVPVDEDLIPNVTLAVAVEAGNIITVSVQVASVLGSANSRSFLLNAWLSDAAAGTEASAAGDGTVGWTTGTALQVVTAKKRWLVVTSAAGAAVLSIENSTVTSPSAWFLNVEIDGRIWTSDSIIFT